MSRQDLTGAKFGRLTVVGPCEPRRYPSGGLEQFWSCLCECGRTARVGRQSLRSGNTRSCGCLKDEGTSERLRTHGQSKKRIYRVWAGMIQRCTNPENPKWDAYGGRGIAVCERWREFENFLADMGEPPSDDHKLDRIDNDGGYGPENCRWVTQSENCRNRRDNRMITARGKTLCVAEWVEETGMSATTIKGRLRLGWDDERIIGTPVDKTVGQYDRTGANEKRKKSSYAERLAAVLVLLKRGNGEPLIPDEIKARGTAAIIGHVQWDHIHPIAMGGTNEFHNLQPMTAVDHRVKTKRDIGEIAKTKRLTKDQEDFRRKVLERPAGQKRASTGRIKSRTAWPKGRKFGQ